MLRRLIRSRTLMLAAGVFAVVALAITATPTRNSAADFTGQEILSVARIAHGGVDYASLQYVTVKATGFVNAVALTVTYWRLA